MLKVTGNGSITTCDGITRRDFLQVGVLGAVGFSMANYAALKAAGAVAKGGDEKSAIMIFNLGAPSQLDTFDPKPNAPREIRGPFQPIKTAGDFAISEMFPLHAKVGDKFSLVRSCYHTAAAVHDTGHQMMQTGRLFTGGINTPHAGCALEFLKGRKTELPAHVILPEPMGPTGGNLPHGQDAGFLSKAYDPFVLNADPSKPDFKVPDLLPPQEIGEARLQRRRNLREVVDKTVKNFEASPTAELMDANFAAALAAWLDRVLALYGDRILPFDLQIARRWGKLSAALGNDSADLMISATALEHGLTVVTRNVSDFEPSGVATFNPFESYSRKD